MGAIAVFVALLLGGLGIANAVKTKWVKLQSQELVGKEFEYRKDACSVCACTQTTAQEALCMCPPWHGVCLQEEKNESICGAALCS